MTLPDERYRALRSIEQRLVDIALKPGPIKKRWLRGEFRAMLRHFPSGYDIDCMAQRCPDLLKPVDDNAKSGLRKRA